VIEKVPISRFYLLLLTQLQATIKEEKAISNRLELVSGSFFESVPAGVDAYLCTTVVHDWSDEKAGEILDVIHRAASPGAKLLLGELVVPEETTNSISKIMSGNNNTYPLPLHGN